MQTRKKVFIKSITWTQGDKLKKLYFLVLDNLQQLEQTKLNTGETNLIGAEGATTPETLRQKDRT